MLLTAERAARTLVVTDVLVHVAAAAGVMVVPEHVPVKAIVHDRVEAADVLVHVVRVTVVAVVLEAQIGVPVVVATVSAVLVIAMAVLVVVLVIVPVIAVILAVARVALIVLEAAVAVVVRAVVIVLDRVLTVVLVPPTQEALILFFKSLIKRIKIDINMTKLQVLGELL